MFELKNTQVKKFFSIVLVAMLLFSCIFSNFFAFASTIQGGRDISYEAVTSLTVSPSKINDGGNVRVRVEFDETRENIKGGDTIVVSWPTVGQGNAYFTGYIKTIRLEIKGKYVGDAVITEKNATITFNESINNLEDVRGWVEFEIQGRNITSTSQEDTKTLNIVSGSKSASVDIIKPESGYKSVFYYKTGNMDTSDTEHVQWFLNINNDKNYVDDRVYILDSIQGGQELDTNSFEIKVEGYYNNYFRGPNAISEFENYFSGASISCYGNEITVIIPREWVTNNFISIMYKTKITEPNQSEFVNNTKAWFKEYGKPEVSGEEFNYSVPNINVDGDITGTVKGELKIVKRLNEKDIPIEGVEFTLKRTDGQAIKNGQTELILKTDSNGIANIKDLPVGEYLVKETSAPEWIAFDPLTAPEKKITLSNEDKEGTLWHVKNELKRTSIPVEKVWVGEAGEEVEIKLLANGTEIESVILNADNGWKHTFEDKPEYDIDTKQKIIYTISETPISGYESKIIDFRNNPEYSENVGNLRDGFRVVNYQKPDLAISKEVTGELGDKTKQFTFDIILKTKCGESTFSPVNGKFDYIGSIVDGYQNEVSKPSDGRLNFIDGKATVTLSHGQKITIKDLPYGVTYQVIEREANTDQYITTYNGKKESSVIGELKQNQKVKVVNNKEFVPVTGIEDTTRHATLIGIGIAIVGIVIIVFISQLRKGMKNGEK